MRQLVFNHLDISQAARDALDSGRHLVRLGGPGTALETGVVLALGLAMLGVAIWEFSATD